MDAVSIEERKTAECRQFSDRDALLSAVALLAEYVENRGGTHEMIEQWKEAHCSFMTNNDALKAMVALLAVLADLPAGGGGAGSTLTPTANGQHYEVDTDPGFGISRVDIP